VPARAEVLDVGFVCQEKQRTRWGVQRGEQLVLCFDWAIEEDKGGR
jgi:hypothetical protein